MSETRTYEITTRDGVFRIEVPATARVSYGPVIGAGGKAIDYNGNCLRVWEGTKATEVQRALFQNVVSFRDLSLPLQVRAVRLFGSEDWWQDNGTWTGKRAELVEKAWKSADEIVPQTDDLVGSVNAYTRGPNGEAMEDVTPNMLGVKPRRDRMFKVEPMPKIVEELF